MNWFEKQEKIKRAKDKRATWRTDVTYSQVKKYQLQNTLELTDFSSCDEGGCTD